MTGFIFFLIALALVYIIYLLYFKKNNVNEITGEIHLAQPPAPVTTLMKPGSVNVTYSLWMYVNQWSSLATKTIFTAQDDSNVYYTLQMGLDKPTLEWKMNNKYTGTTPDTETVNITNSFPLQKWVFVTISISGRIVDFYVNGKMVKSVQSKNAPEINVTKIVFGSNFDCYIRKFRRVIESSSQEQVNDEYLTGNGMMALSSASSLEGRVEILKDSQVQTSVKLF